MAIKIKIIVDSDRDVNGYQPVVRVNDTVVWGSSRRYSGPHKAEDEASAVVRISLAYLFYSNSKNR